MAIGSRMVLQRALAGLWWGPLRRPVEAISRRVCSRRKAIISGPLSGLEFEGGLAHMLGVYEYPLQCQLNELIEPGQVFFDIGAHLGFITLLAAKAVGKNGLVVACEPHPEIARSLRHALEINQFSNCVVLEVALGSCPGKSQFATGGVASMQGHLVSEATGDDEVVVEVTSLDDLAELYGYPDIVNVDIEGYESVALEGATTILSSESPPTWLIEIHSEAQSEKCGVTLQEHGYEPQTIPRPRRGPDYPRHVLAVRSPESAT